MLPTTQRSIIESNDSIALLVAVVAMEIKAIRCRQKALMGLLR